MSDSTGSFIWYELMTTDSDAAAQFYGSVVGWTIGNRADSSPGGRDYRMIGRADGGFNGGVLRLTAKDTQEGAHTTWLGYLQVKDVDAAVRSIVADGGKLYMPRMDLPVGSIAMVSDPFGVPFYVMSPIPPPGRPEARSDVFDREAAQRVRWNELSSVDLERAKSFYAKHFGFEFKETMPMGPAGDYCFISQGGVPMIGALMQKQPSDPVMGWLFYFGVTSVAAARQAIVSGGGKVLRGPHQVPGGDWIVVASDPQGAFFGVVGPPGD